MKIIALGIVCILLLVGSLFFLVDKNVSNNEVLEEIKIYQGPVPQGYNLSCYQDIGKTILLNEVCE